jgi:FKBP-type peptidyl-prolyl cis-trans isomerase SlyD
MIIADKKVVLMHYTLTDDSGETLDTSKGEDPLGFIYGIGNIIPGLEKAIAGKKVGDKVKATVPPEEGYGVKKDDLIQTAPLSKFDNPKEIEVGVQFEIETPERVMAASVTKVDKDTVTFDMNHPLADLTLHFDVEITEIREATKEELEHGHVHGPGGHHH